jgi:hypothetical protein
MRCLWAGDVKRYGLSGHDGGSVVTAKRGRGGGGGGAGMFNVAENLSLTKTDQGARIYRGSKGILHKSARPKGKTSCRLDAVPLVKSFSTHTSFPLSVYKFGSETNESAGREINVRKCRRIQIFDNGGDERKLHSEKNYQRTEVREMLPATWLQSTLSPGPR